MVVNRKMESDQVQYQLHWSLGVVKLVNSRKKSTNLIISNAKRYKISC